MNKLLVSEDGWKHDPGFGLRTIDIKVVDEKDISEAIRKGYKLILDVDKFYQMLKELSSGGEITTTVKIYIGNILYEGSASSRLLSKNELEYLVKYGENVKMEIGIWESYEGFLFMLVVSSDYNEKVANGFWKENNDWGTVPGI